ncbi:TRAP transporter small permease [Billgrantia endophytica]|uniref:TRAP transporter small permease n=1 Tax=Billgrantia endophytica TaxID=2033802 RepID=UPI0013FDE9EB|nr:TRAP transporter small permease [Halomonas endophytica]
MNNNPKDSKSPAAYTAAGLFLNRLLDMLDEAVSRVVIAFLAVLVTVVSAQVVLRYFFNSSIDWAWEFSRLCFVAVIFFAIPLALKTRGHVGIDILQKCLPPLVQRGLIIGLNVIGIFLMMVVTLVGARATMSTWDQTLSSLPLSSGWFYIPVLWAGFHCSLHFAAQSLDLALGGELPASFVEEVKERMES